jgi:hypothetical protein
MRRTAVDEALMKLRGKVIETSNDLLKAQGVYLNAFRFHSRKHTLLKEAVEEYLESAEHHETALQNLLEYLFSKAERSEAVDAEINRTRRLINAVSKEKAVALKLTEHYLKLINREAAPSRRSTR